MSGRDRIVAMVVAVVVALAAVWLLAVSPERKQAAKLQSQLATASAQLTAAEGQVASARTAQASYAAAYASIVSLGKAVPASREVPSLVYQLAQASRQRHVDFASIATSTSGTSGAASASAATASTTLTGFTQMPFTFMFTGTFFDLYKMFEGLNSFTARTSSGTLRVSGRLLTIQSVKLAPTVSAGETAASPGESELLTGTITATAYVLPATQGLTGGATPGAPAGSASSATPAAASAPSASSPAPAAVVKAIP